MHTLPNSTSSPPRGAEAKHKHKHGSCRGQQLCTGSGSAAADDLGSGQQGSSSADPGVDTIELLHDADEEAGLTVRCMLLFVFIFARVLVFVGRAFMPVPDA